MFYIGSNLLLGWVWDRVLRARSAALATNPKKNIKLKTKNFSGKAASTHSEYLGQAWTFRSEDNGSTPGVGKVLYVTTLVSKLPNFLNLQIFLYYVLGIVNNICN